MDKLKQYKDYLIMLLDSFEWDEDTGRARVTVVVDTDEYYHDQFPVNDGLADLLEEIREALTDNKDWRPK